MMLIYDTLYPRKHTESSADEDSNQEAYTGEIIQEWRSFKATFEAVTSPRRKWAALAAVTTVLDYIASSFSSHDRDKYM